MSDSGFQPRIHRFYGNKNVDDNKPDPLDRLYREIYANVMNSLQSNGYTFKQEGYALFCEPCPVHRDNPYDRVILDVLAKADARADSQPYWTCAKDPTAVINQLYVFSGDEMKIVKAVKPSSKEVIRTRTEVIVYHFLSNNHVISISQGSDQNKLTAIFVYDPKKAHYVLYTEKDLRKKLQSIYKSIYADSNAPSTLLEPAVQEIEELTDHGGDMSMFDHNGDDIYYLPGLKKDLRISRYTGKIEVLDKDPVNRPFLYALPYDLDIPILGEIPEEVEFIRKNKLLSEINELRGGDPKKVAETIVSDQLVKPYANNHTPGCDKLMPEELCQLRELVSPGSFNNLLFELASALALKPMRYIWVNFSFKGGTGKTQFLKRFRDLYGDFVVWLDTQKLGDRFGKSALLGKSAVLIDEHEGGGSGIKRALKMLASDNELVIEVKFGPILNVKNELSFIANSNKLRFGDLDDALLDRIIIIAFVKNFKRTEHPPKWSDEAKKKIIAYLIKHVLRRYFKEEAKQYPEERLRRWLADSDANLKKRAKKSVIKFIKQYAYPEFDPNNSNGVFTPIDKAFVAYLHWCDTVNIVPVSFKIFVKQLEKLRDKPGEDYNRWLLQDEYGRYRVYMKKDVYTVNHWLSLDEPSDQKGEQTGNQKRS